MLDFLEKLPKITPDTQMTSITTTLTDDELTRLGRAMERLGYTSVEEFFKDALLNRVNETLITAQQHGQTEQN